MGLTWLLFLTVINTDNLQESYIPFGPFQTRIECVEFHKKAIRLQFEPHYINTRQTICVEEELS